MCWSSEPGAVGAAPEPLRKVSSTFCERFRRKIGPAVYKKSTKKGEAYFHQLILGLSPRMMEFVALRAEREAGRRSSDLGFQVVVSLEFADLYLPDILNNIP